jgi:excisionase family DNA binding protein
MELEAERFDPTRPLTVSPVARLLRVSVESVRRLSDVGALPCTRTPGGVRLFDFADVIVFARARQRRRLAREAGDE